MILQHLGEVPRAEHPGEKGVGVTDGSGFKALSAAA